MAGIYYMLMQVNRNTLEYQYSDYSIKYLIGWEMGPEMLVEIQQTEIK